jgi:thymidylate synthase
MKDIFIEGKTLAEAYHKGILAMFAEGELADCADWGQTQKECRMTLHIEEPLSEPRISRQAICGPKELRQYEMEILDGLIDFAPEVIKENGERLEDYTYSQRIRKSFGYDQIRFVIDELKRSPSSRRAVIGVRDNVDDHALANPACLQSIQYFIRDGRLDCCVLFRSNDFAQAFFMNAFGLISLQEKIAGALGVPVGTYSHTSNSMHVYERNFDMFSGYAAKIQHSDPSDLVYEYEGMFKDIMEDYDEEIINDWNNVKAKYGVR